MSISEGLGTHLLQMSEQRFTAAGGDLSQQMSVQIVNTRDVNQLSPEAELASALVTKILLLQKGVRLKHEPPGCIQHIFWCIYI